MTVWKSASAEETRRIGEKLAQTLKGDEVIALFGGLGMGKTMFTTGLACGLGIEDGVSSPTFALCNVYNGKFTVYHFDMYRISGWDDLYAVGFFDYLGTGVLVIEWSENIAGALPEHVISVDLRQGNGETERVITIDGWKGGRTPC